MRKNKAGALLTAQGQGRPTNEYHKRPPRPGKTMLQASYYKVFPNLKSVIAVTNPAPKGTFLKKTIHRH